ncbi:unnamed protein product, partial [Adineta ricciae]
MTNISIPGQESSPQDVNQTMNDRNSSRDVNSIGPEFRSRYWIFLFDNLKRSIEQIYQACESDHDTLQCQEVLQYLCQCSKNFEILIDNVQHRQTDDTSRIFRSLSSSTYPFQIDIPCFRPIEHSQSMCNRKLNTNPLVETCSLFQLDEFLGSDHLVQRQKRLHNSDINLNINHVTPLTTVDAHRFKRQKSNRYRKSTESSSLLSLPALFSSTALTNDSTMTLTPSPNQLFLSTKRIFTDEAAADADDEKDIRDESTDNTRPHRYYHQLSASRLKQQNITSEDDDEELLLTNHRGMIDFMDRQIFDAFDQEESLTAALEAEQERTIASLMAEQEDLEHQLNNV